MAAKQYDLESSVLDWYRDFCPENSFDVQIRPDITFADVGLVSAILNNGHKSVPSRFCFPVSRDFYP